MTEQDSGAIGPQGHRHGRKGKGLDYARLIREWLALGISLVAVAVSISAYREGRETRRATRSLEVQDLLTQAWDLLGREEGTRGIADFESNPQRLELAKRRIEKAMGLDESNYLAHLLLGSYCLAVKKEQQAEIHYRKAKELKTVAPVTKTSSLSGFWWSHPTVLPEAVPSGPVVRIRRPVPPPSTAWKRSQRLNLGLP